MANAPNRQTEESREPETLCGSKAAIAGSDAVVVCAREPGHTKAHEGWHPNELTLLRWRKQ
jgi:hypothetical protein